MSTMGDFTIEHKSRCDYCLEIEEREDLTDEEKWEKQAEHALEIG